MTKRTTKIPQMVRPFLQGILATHNSLSHLPWPPFSSRVDHHLGRNFWSNCQFSPSRLRIHCRMSAMISWPVDRAPTVGIPCLCMQSSVFERRAHIILFRLSSGHCPHGTRNFMYWFSRLSCSWKYMWLW
jgi:hypothetical protein